MSGKVARNEAANSGRAMLCFERLCEGLKRAEPWACCEGGEREEEEARI